MLLSFAHFHDIPFAVSIAQTYTFFFFSQFERVAGWNQCVDLKFIYGEHLKWNWVNWKEWGSCVHRKEPLGQEGCWTGAKGGETERRSLNGSWLGKAVLIGIVSKDTVAVRCLTFSFESLNKGKSSSPEMASLVLLLSKVPEFSLINSGSFLYPMLITLLFFLFLFRSSQGSRTFSKGEIGTWVSGRKGPF